MAVVHKMHNYLPAKGYLDLPAGTSSLNTAVSSSQADTVCQRSGKRLWLCADRTLAIRKTRAPEDIPRIFSTCWSSWESGQLPAGGTFPGVAESPYQCHRIFCGPASRYMMKQHRYSTVETLSTSDSRTDAQAQSLESQNQLKIYKSGVGVCCSLGTARKVGMNSSSRFKLLYSLVFSTRLEKRTRLGLRHFDS